MGPHIDPWQLQIVLVGAEELNAVKAAVRLKVNQSTVSKGIRQFEKKQELTVFVRDGKRIADQFGHVWNRHTLFQQYADERIAELVRVGRRFPRTGKFENLLQSLVPPDIAKVFCVPRCAGGEYKRAVDLFPTPQAIDEPVWYPSKERAFGLVHPQENVVSVQAFGDIECCDIRNSKARVDRQIDKVLGVLASPRSVARPLLKLRADLVAGRVQTIEFRVGERGFGNCNG